MKKKEKRILVTGGAGFLGSHLCETLLALGHKIFCLDNFSTGNPNNLASFQNDPGFELITHDICNPFFIEVDEIYNLACPASPFHYQSDPIRTILTSVQGALNMLELSKKTGARILQASTSEVYGDPHVHPQDESYWGNVNPIGKRACYDEGKRCVETLFFDYHREYKIPIKVARIFNTYGPRMQLNDGRVISNFLVQALQNLPITVYGNGKQTRSFCFVSDMVDGLIRLMHSPESFTGPVNLGNPIEYTMIELSNIIRKLTGSTSPTAFQPLPVDDPQKRKPSIQLAKSVLSWEPKIDLEAGIKRSIDYFKEILQTNMLSL